MKKSTEINKQTSEFWVSLTLEGSKWTEAITTAQKHLLTNVSVKGFRKGKAPEDLALKQLKKADIYSHAIKDQIEELGKEANKAITKEVMVIDGPSYLVENVDENKLEIRFIYPIYPEIALASYKNLKVKYDEKKVNDEVVDKELKRIKTLKVKTNPKEGKIINGDVVKFDFEGFVDGKPFEGGKGEKFDLEIGSGKFIPGFEEQMVGLNKDDEKEIKVTFPETYHAENLKGKEATFKIKIHQISTKEAPKLDDDFVKSLAIKDVDSLTKLKEYLNDVFAMQFKQEARLKFQREIFDKILEKTKLIIPPSLIGKEIKAVSQQMQNDLKKQNLTLEQYMQFTGMDKNKLNAQFHQAAQKRLSDAFVFAEIARQEKIQLDEKDYEAEYVKLAKVYRNTVDGIKGMITKQQMQIPMTNDRVIDLLIGYNKD